MAASIPGARFVALEGHNHLVLEGEPASRRLFDEIRNFLDQVSDPTASTRVDSDTDVPI